MSRRQDRERAFKIIFSVHFNAEPMQDAINSYFANFDDCDETIDAPELEYVEKVCFGTHEHLSEIDALISKSAEGWDLERFSSVDLMILRVAVFEMLFIEDIPVGVSVNEAVELAKVFSLDNSPSFINGVLSEISEIIGIGRKGHKK
ncbi:MAG: transcription antitermination factor NusB [Clostridiales bacterium]|jgi:N utilization substance protein B|nr:transcription antitermination factor NusB [Clostridiales bacterium]